MSSSGNLASSKVTYALLIHSALSPLNAIEVGRKHLGLFWLISLVEIPM